MSVCRKSGHLELEQVFTLPLYSLRMENHQPLILESLDGSLNWLVPLHLVVEMLVLPIINGIVYILGGISVVWRVTTHLHISH